MLLALLLVLVGLAALVYGMTLASERRRPLDLAGALMAAAGLAAALLGVGRLLSNSFFSG